MKTQDFAHDFPGTTINPALFDVSGSPTVSGRRAKFGVGDAATIEERLSLHNSYMYQKFEIEPGITVLWRVEANATNSLEFLKFGDELFLRITTSGIVSTVSLPYDPAQHLWWRLRHSTGIIYFDTSADGKEWINRRNAALGFSVSSVAISYQAVILTGYGYGGWGFTPWGGDFSGLTGWGLSGWGEEGWGEE